ncbi:MAG: sporulation initiation factor Spo0A C-terminal domain-containing protein [Andreesenia angusta]|nr:sporulation initiation factor Spo0A C-terminal domain-containing protein [Andreesenia angusta]
MSKKKEKLLIVDDNLDICKILSKLVSESEDFELAGVANDGIMALDMMRSQDYDIIILDLAMPKLDGLGLLQRMERIYTDRMRPTVIIFSAIGQDEVTLRAMELGADYFIIKPFNLKELIQRMKEIHFDKRRKYFRNASDILMEIGVPMNLSGYIYLREAIEIVRDEESFLKSINKGLYKKIAEIHKTTPSRIERAIRHAIAVAWERDADKKLKEIMDKEIRFKRYRPSNSELIAVLADIMR